AISSFFTSEVKRQASASRSYSEANGQAAMQMQVDESTFVRSQTELFAVRYTDAWLDPRTKEYATVGYINRDEAWNIFEPRLRQSSDTLRNIADAAAADTEALKRFMLYTRAQGLGGEALRLLDFARILDAGKARRFSETEALISSLPAKIDAAKSGVSIFINYTAEADSLVSSALAEVLSAQGFSVSRDKKAAAYVCSVTVEGNPQKLEAGTFYTPSVLAAVSGKAGVLFTWSANLPRVGAQNPDVAKRRANTAVAEKIKQSFADEFVKQMTNS
ncbi:MAG: hypothetical protein LBT68_01275, partial [Spirochaetales bacterium]|nr:hypothetical protein [Spirochaetales bacterium]